MPFVAMAIKNTVSCDSCNHHVVEERDGCVTLIVLWLSVFCVSFLWCSGDKNISILHLSCRTSDLQFSLVLQTHAFVLKKYMQ